MHLVRSSLRFVPYRDKRAVAADLKKIYTSVDVDAAADEARQRFADKWDHRYPTISRSWLEHWERVIPFGLPASIRRVVYTTNTIEALNRQIRKIIKTRGTSQPRRRPQADLPRDHPRPNQMASRLQLERRPGRLQDPLRRPHPRRNLTFTSSHHHTTHQHDQAPTRKD